MKTTTKLQKRHIPKSPVSRFFKVLVLFILFSSVHQIVLSNPLIPEAKITISELVFTVEGWKLEVVAKTTTGANNLDSVTIETSAGKAHFKSGITFTDGQILILTSDSLKTPLKIEPNGDFIHLEEYYDNSIIWSSEYRGDIIFGNYAGAKCSALISGQSISVVKGSCVVWIMGNPSMYEPLLITKSNTPTLGSNPFSNIEKDTLKGTVVDKNDKPINKVKINYLYSSDDYKAYSLPVVETNGNGYFEGLLYSSYYNYAKVSINDSIYKIVHFKVELDSANMYNIKFENYVTGNKCINLDLEDFKIKAFPNPAGNSTCFEVNLKSSLSVKKAIIKIYNVNGQIVGIVPVKNFKNSNLQWVDWDIDNKIPNGEYVYCLEINNTPVKSDKILIFR